MRKSLPFAVIMYLLFSITGYALAPQMTNKPERVNGYQDLDFGMFIQSNAVEVPGAAISHSLAGASDEYVEKYFRGLL